MAKNSELVVPKIVDMKTCSPNQLEDAARVLYESFGENWPDAWPTIEDARAEVRECTGEERIVRAAVGTEGSIVGWIGGISTYNGMVWELHPLCVSTEKRKQGIGSLLVEALEKSVAECGGMTIYLGTDDENNQTSLGGADIYDGTWERMKNIRNLNGHPFTFYQSRGYKIVGVVPDANGYGKPDIMMAKRVGTNFGEAKS